MNDIKNENPAAEKPEEGRTGTDLAEQNGIRIRRSNPVATAFVLLLLCAALVTAGWLIFSFLQSRTEQPAQEESRKTVAVTGVSSGNGMLQRLTENTPLTEEATETPESETEENPEEIFFGSALPSVASSQLTVEGLSTADKEKTGFRESDFVRAASEFLEKNGIEADRITFREEITCSSDASAYEALIDGREDKILSVLFYPDFPGRYIFILQDARTVTVPVQTQQTERTQTVQDIPTQTEAPQRETEETETPYDATELSVTGMTGTLQNYLENYYELQYRLYEYLYRNGYRDMKSVNVEDYEIDADTRTAVIYLKLPDGSIIICSYRRDENSYSFQ